MRDTLFLSCVLWALISACQAPHTVDAKAADASAGGVRDHSLVHDSLANPAQVHVLLEAESSGWEASLVLENGDIGVWTVKALPFFPQYATDELFGLDDEGRCWVLVQYSGKWTPMPVLRDGKWLGALTQGDVDPRVTGGEVYTGGEMGRLYQLRAYADGGLDARRIASFPGKELHTVVAGEFDVSNESAELLVFTRPGHLYRVTPTGEHGEWQTESLGELPSRVRDAVVIPAASDTAASELITASRDGSIQLLRWQNGEPQWQLIHQVAQGRGRLAMTQAPDKLLLYSTVDDGRVFRHERGLSGDWRSEVIYRGSQGPRGLVAGRFGTERDTETVIVYGYSGRVELLSRKPGQQEWSTELLFVDRDKGHWLGAGEFDGRNETLEVFASGYGGRIVMLSRKCPN